MMANSPLSAQYRDVMLPAVPSDDDLCALIAPYQALIAAQFSTIVARAEQRRTDSQIYPWLDTKFDLNTGRDFPPDDPWLGRGLVSGWVQGRGLEGLAAFGAWLAPHADDPVAAAWLARVRGLARDLTARMRAVRSRNGGHLYFAMTPEGEPFVYEAARRVPVALDAASPSNYSDLFAAKGLYAAAHFLGDPEAIRDARGYCLAVYDAILAGRFRSDQPQPAGLASLVAVPGGASHGPAMIALGMAALFARHEPGPDAVEMGLRLARWVLGRHVNLAGRWPGLRDHDLVEFIAQDGGPAHDLDGRIISDPGHTLEFVGLFLKFRAAVQRSGGDTAQQAQELARMARLMPAILARAFDNGFRPAVGGIIKSLDLLTRRAIDDTMPWWSLPETIRAAAALLRAVDLPEDAQLCRRVISLCHNAFTAHYLRPDVHLMAVKLRDASGRASGIVPAYPDADPGYHTALSLMDVLAFL